MHTGIAVREGRFSWAIAVVLYFIMKTASKVAIILLVAVSRAGGRARGTQNLCRRLHLLPVLVLV
jgi:hypothetical protein